MGAATEAADFVQRNLVSIAIQSRSHAERFSNPLWTKRPDALMCQCGTMFTRAFLLLLAMMTGLSVAQAAEVLRPQQIDSGVSISAVGGSRAGATDVDLQKSAVHVADFRAAPKLVLAIADKKQRLLALPAVTRTFRSDRSRE